MIVKWVSILSRLYLHGIIEYMIVICLKDEMTSSFCMKFRTNYYTSCIKKIGPSNFDSYWKVWFFQMQYWIPLKSPDHKSIVSRNYVDPMLHFDVAVMSIITGNWWVPIILIQAVHLIRELKDHSCWYSYTSNDIKYWNWFHFFYAPMLPTRLQRS